MGGRVADLKESIAARIAELDAKIAARTNSDGNALSGFTANVAAVKAARAELQRILDAADG
jgi:hypothetical protein